MVRTRFLNDGADTLARRVSALGYQTSLFSNNPFLTSFTNLGAGFEHIEDIWLDSNLKYNRGLVERLSAIINGGASSREKMFKASYYMTRMLPKGWLDWLYLGLRARLTGEYAMPMGPTGLTGAPAIQRGRLATIWTAGTITGRSSCS